MKTGSTRTPEQTQIGLFWIESSPLSWNRIARTVSASEGLDLWKNARLFGLLNITMADGYIATFDAKYFYKFWRPVTAIQLADTDSNPATIADSAWEPLAPTPLTDFPFYDESNATEPLELQSFLAAGESPIVFTLGSSVVRDAGDFYQESVAASRQVSKRAVLLIGHEPSNHPAQSLGEDIFAVPYTPSHLLGNETCGTCNSQ